ncbi:RecQ family ATP-dependent DNA helicase [Flavobacteriaceae bacterium Ap0902]|nr:RecQ family ATP-dependent DNA helicase [Flavobacteriaceae bacterium Ap0902]
MAETPIEILKKYWGYNEFIHPQSQIVKSVLERNDTFALLPTGGGKSITFQIPIMLMDGLCVVISPLIALMKDQVKNLKEKGIKAALISSEISKIEINAILDNCRFGKTKFLYISPERMQSQGFIASLKTLEVAYFAVDEAHCIVEWGHDFRPSYLALKNIRELYPDTPILALTATATPQVQEEIIKQLMLYKPKVFKKSLQRQNLAYRIEPSEDKWKDILYLLKRHPGSTIIFCRSRKDTYQLSKFLIENGFDADYYHARLSAVEKNQKQKDFIESDSKILISTNAFGMGIDKPNVRLVIHETAPDSIESYFQEVGRGGRDGMPATGILLYNEADKKNAFKAFKTSHPDRDTFRDIIRKLYNFYQIAEHEKREGQLPFSEKKFREQYQLHKQKTKSVLQFLERKKIITIHKTQRQSLVKILIKNYEVNDDSSIENKVLDFTARHYGGIFQNPLPIDEYFIAQRLKIPSYQVKKSLKDLHDANKIFYRDASIIKISFLEPRDDNAAKITYWKDFERLQKVKWDRLTAMHYFAQEESICKSQLLLRYFGEKNTAKCGICNICKPHVSKQELNTNQLLSYLSNQPKTLEEIERDFIHIDKKIIYHKLQYLLDEEKINLKLPNTYYI